MYKTLNGVRIVDGEPSTCTGMETVNVTDPEVCTRASEARPDTTECPQSGFRCSVEVHQTLSFAPADPPSSPNTVIRPLQEGGVISPTAVCFPSVLCSGSVFSTTTKQAQL